MADHIQAIRETCTCGHDICTHFDYQGVRVNCLALNCNCKCYVNEWDEEERTNPGIGPPVRNTYDMYRDAYREALKNRPHTDWKCACRACQIYDNK